nr:uncharacterized protein LOC104650920 [Saimiri boliviensis boliviensis]XP_039330688.1 uncharacterized protein LOC104650920 [Saimiri boliviensis boliviensis]
MAQEIISESEILATSFLTHPMLMFKALIVQRHSPVTCSYVFGTHCIIFVNCSYEKIARDIVRSSPRNQTRVFQVCFTEPPKLTKDYCRKLNCMEAQKEGGATWAAHPLFHALLYLLHGFVVEEGREGSGLLSPMD